MYKMIIDQKPKRPRYKKVRGWLKKQRTAVKVSRITSEGFWLHLPHKDYFVSREAYPWFKDATHREIQDIRLFYEEYEITPDDPDNFYYDEGQHLRWESLDVDLGTNSFEYPERFPVMFTCVRGVPRPDLFCPAVCNDK